MKQSLYLWLLCLLLGSACSTDFKVGAPYREVTVVYGLLSMSDTAHYIKVMKGYYDETSDNLSLARQPDSLYFPNLEVKIEDLSNGNVVQTTILNRVDLEQEGYPKNTGTFANIPNYAYKFKRALDPNRTYRLRVRNLNSGKEVTAETPVINSLSSVFRFVKPSSPLDELVLNDQNNPFVFTWRGPQTAVIYDVVIRFFYQEVNMNNPTDTTYHNYDIPVLRNLPGSNGDINGYLGSVEFFKQVNSIIPAAGTEIRRYIDTPGLRILAGGQILKTFIEVNSAQGGITFDQIRPNYTNLQGENVYGLLSTRGQIDLPMIRFGAGTLDSLRNGVFTKGLRFVGTSTK